MFGSQEREGTREEGAGDARAEIRMQSEKEMME